MGKYFGTDGFRGEAGVGLTAEHAFKIGRFLGWYYGQLKRLTRQLHPGDDEPCRARIVLGKDTRRSSYMLEYALASGIAASGGDAYTMHVTTTPSVAYVARTEDFDCGVMVSASHNPYSDNGIKLMDGNGEKAGDDLIALVEAYLDDEVDCLGFKGSELPWATGAEVGAVEDHFAGRNRYVGFLISQGIFSLRGKRIGLDCANGASWSIARSVFESMGAKVYTIGCEPDGTNINAGVGSTHIEALQELVRAEGLDCGFAYDGDADRCLAVDEHGNLIDGDKIMYICARYMKDKGHLVPNEVTTTVMSNLGLYKALDEAGIEYAQTQVGDRYVWEHMRTSGGRMLYTAAAVVCLMLLAALTLYLDKNQGVLKLAGKEVRLLPQKAKYTAIYLTCVGGILAVAAAQFLGAMAAYYLVYAVVAWLFALLVYYTVKMM